MERLELRIPPPAITLFFGLAMWLSACYVPHVDIEVPAGNLVSGLLVMLGIFCDVAGFLAFRDRRTTINPLKPANTLAIVSHGIYRHTRNPMYLGLLLFLTAWAFWLTNLLAFVFLPGFVIYLTRFQIIPEEHILGAKFGSTYSDYQQRVRRWC